MRTEIPMRKRLEATLGLRHDRPTLYRRMSELWRRGVRVGKAVLLDGTDMNDLAEELGADRRLLAAGEDSELALYRCPTGYVVVASVGGVCVGVQARAASPARAPTSDARASLGFE